MMLFRSIMENGTRNPADVKSVGNTAVGLFQLKRSFLAT